MQCARSGSFLYSVLVFHIHSDRATRCVSEGGLQLLSWTLYHGPLDATVRSKTKNAIVKCYSDFFFVLFFWMGVQLHIWPPDLDACMRWGGRCSIAYIAWLCVAVVRTPMWNLAFGLDRIHGLLSVRSNETRVGIHCVSNCVGQWFRKWEFTGTGRRHYTHKSLKDWFISLCFQYICKDEYTHKSLKDWSISLCL